MKKFLAILTLFLGLGVFAQKEVAKRVNELIAQNVNFKPYTILNLDSESLDNKINSVVGNATLAKINSQSVVNLVNSKEEYIEVDIPYQGENIKVQLYKVKILAEGFHVDTDKSIANPYEQGVHYRGIVKGDINSVVSFNFFNNELNGIISNERLTNLVIGKLEKANNTTDYIIYSDEDLKILNDFKCHNKEVNTPVQETNNNELRDIESTKCVSIYFELQYSLYLANGSDTTTTTNWMTSVFNNLQTLYNNDGISIGLKSIFIWTTQDPYFGETSSDYLFQFNDNRCVFDGDLGQLIGINDGGLGGVAVGINGLCTQSNFSFSDVNFDFNTVPTFSWTIMVIAHELGHLMGSPHTHGCHWNGDETAIDGCGQSVGYFEGTCEEAPIPSTTVKGTIMSYCHLVQGVGINLANGFGPQPKNLILSKVNNAGCLGTNCTNTCIDSVCSISSSNITNSSALIEWVESNVNTTSWQLNVSPFSGPITPSQIVTTNSFNVTSLAQNTFYKAQVSPVCGAIFTPPSNNTFFLTAANYCDGIVLTDTGGSTDDYEDDQTYIRTIIPNLPNKKINLTFTFFDLELDYDYVYIYDGNSTDAPDLSGGGFTGTNIPGPFESTAADGSLTLKFYSDGGVIAPGYVANVACSSTLKNESNIPNIDFTYFPNPTNGLVTIDSNSTINEITVYNPEGRLLYQNSSKAKNAKVDIASFAAGTYFFKLKFNEKEVNFKILKFN